MITEVAEGDERARLWSCLVEAYPAYADCQRGTERQIPLVVLLQDTRVFEKTLFENVGKGDVGR